MIDFILYKKEISEFLINFLGDKKIDLKDSTFSQDVLERIMPLATGGKMWRGSLLINTYEQLSGQKYSPEVLEAAAALELVGTALLIHDDIIDQDELRRGQETLHFQYQQLSHSQKFGESMAICAGDLIFLMAFGLLSGELNSVFSQQLSRTILGEMQDVDFATKTEITQDEIFQLYVDKTASYTVSLPLMAGTVLADQNQELILQLKLLGQTLGLIFQIKDDGLGLFGDKQQTGKPVGADIREGKKTLYYYYLEQVAPNAFIDKNVTEILELMKTHQIERQVNKDLAELAVKAKQQIKNLDSEKLKPMLLEFLEVNLRREK